MKSVFNKSVITYIIGILILVAAVGGILSLVVTNYIVLISALLIMYIILVVIMLQIFHKYIKPIEKTSRIVTELVEGNFRARIDRKSTRLNSSHVAISYAVFCLKKQQRQC